MTPPVQDIREDFPVLEETVNGEPLVYLDNAATSLTPESVVDAVTRFYTEYNANVHRGIHGLSEEATDRFEQSRETMARFLNTKAENIVFTSGATEGLNMAAHGLQHRLNEDANVVISELEHHANIVPWQQRCERMGAELRYVPVDMETGRIDADSANTVIDDETEIVAVSHCSNVLGSVNPVKTITKVAHDHDAVTVVDAAQSIPHMPVNVETLDADLVTFSGHKMLGPTGTGVLTGKKNVLDELEPYRYGGEMIRTVTKQDAEWDAVPQRFEGGTPNIAGVIGLQAAVQYLETIGMETIKEHSRELAGTAAAQLRELDGVTVYGGENRLGLVSFTTEKGHPHDIASLLNMNGVAIRAGHHCAQPLHEDVLNEAATARASFYLYNTKDEINTFADSVEQAVEVFTQ